MNTVIQNQQIPKTSRRHATIANLIHQYVTIVITFANGILLVPLYLKHIEFSLYGAWLATGSIIAWLGMVDAGLSEILRQKTANIYGASDYEQSGSIIGTGIFCSSVMGLLPGMISGLSAPWIGTMFHLPGDSEGALSLSFALAGLSVTMVIIAGSASSVLEGLQRNISVCLIYTTCAIIGIVSTVFFLLKDFGLISIPLGLVIRHFLAGMLYWTYMYYVCRYKMGFNLKVSFSLIREIASLTGWTFLYKASFEIATQCDALLIGLVLGVNTTPLYVLTRRSWDILRQFLSRIGVAFMPSMAHLYGQNRKDIFNSIALRLLQTVAYVSILGVSVCLTMNRTFVSLWVGSSLYAGLFFDFLVATTLIMEMYIWTMNQVLYARGHIRQPAMVGFLQNVLRIGLLLLLIYPFGIIGVIVSIPLSILIIGFPYFLHQWCKWLALSREQIGRDILSVATKALFFGVVAYLLNDRIVAVNWPDFTMKTILVSILLGAALIAVDRQCRDDLFTVARSLSNRMLILFRKWS